MEKDGTVPIPKINHRSSPLQFYYIPIFYWCKTEPHLHSTGGCLWNFVRHHFDATDELPRSVTFTEELHFRFESVDDTFRRVTQIAVLSARHWLACILSSRVLSVVAWHGLIRPAAGSLPRPHQTVILLLAAGCSVPARPSDLRVPDFEIGKSNSYGSRFRSPDLFLFHIFITHLYSSYVFVNPFSLLFIRICFRIYSSSSILRIW